MNLFEVAVALTMDDKDFQEKVRGAGDKASALGSGVVKAFGVAGAAVGAAGTAVAAFAKQSMDGYAEYEQLVGGIETLFGAGGQSIEEYAASVGKSVDAIAGEYNTLMGAQDLVLANAEKAYQTAGMSMNDYMNTAIQSAAALTNSLKGDTAEAARLMDMSIVDMSDNVNKMGTTMEAVQNAYRGFSRGNFTMLDNLALGFSGTKEGMQQLLDKAQEISGFKYDISSYSDIVQAIHVVQEEMGIAGTTQKEANETISGSMNSLRAAWDNLIVGFSKGDADISALIDNVVNAAVTVADNVIPVVTRAVSGIVNGIEQAAPLVAEELPKFVDTVLPDILSAGTTLLTSLGEVLPETLLSVLGTLGGVVIDYLPQLAEIATNLVTTLADGISSAIPVAIPAAVGGIFDALGTIAEHVPDLFAAGVEIVGALIQGISEAFAEAEADIPDLIDTIVTGITENVPGVIEDIVSAFETNYPLILDNILDFGFQLVESFTYAVEELAPVVAEALPGLISTVLTELTEGLPKVLDFILANIPILIDTAVTVLSELIPVLITDVLPMLLEAIPTFVTNIITVIGERGPDIIDAIIDGAGRLLDSLWEALDPIFEDLGEFLGDIIDDVTEWFGELPGRIGEWFEGVFEEIGGAFDQMIEDAGQFFEDIGEDISLFLEDLPYNIGYALGLAIGTIAQWGTDVITWIGENVPVFIDNIVTFFSELPGRIWEWLSNVISDIGEWGVQMGEDASQAASDTVDGIIEFFSELPGRVWEWLTNVVDDIVQWGSDALDAGKKAAEDLVDGIVEAVTDLPGQLWNIGVNAVESFVGGISSMAEWVWDKVTGFFGGVIDGVKKAFGIASPSKVFRGIGRNVMEGAAEGIDDGMPEVADAMDTFENEINRDFKTPVIHLPVEEITGMYGGGQEYTVPRREEPKQVTVVLELDRIPFGKAVFELWNDEAQKHVQVIGGLA